MQVAYYLFLELNGLQNPSQNRILPEALRILPQVVAGQGVGDGPTTAA